MALALDMLAWLCLVAGSFFLLVGVIGMLRFPDFFTRIHAASVSDTLGTALIILGLCLEAGGSAPVIKLILALVLIWFTAPVANHALAKAAIRNGMRPLVVDNVGASPDTDVRQSAP